jgi:phospholipase/carboxylesterase
MNRIRRWPAAALKSLEAIPHQESASLESSVHRSAECRLFAPHHYEPGYAYPLLVWLHGPGDDERQLRRIMPHISLRNYVGVGPRGCCPPELGQGGFLWRQNEEAIGRAEQRVFDAIETARRRYNVAEDRIFLGGFQCGGTMALRIGLRYPASFAGVLSIGGCFPRNLAPLTNLPAIQRLPLFIAQGRESRSYSLDVACEEMRLFHAAGLRVMIRQYPCGDDLTTQMLHDMDLWMMERINGVMPDSPPCHALVLPCEEN